MSARRLHPRYLLWEGELKEGWVLEHTSGGTVAARAARPDDGPPVERIVLPGLVNAHSHAFQRLIRGRTEHAVRGHESDDFWSWRELMYQAAATLEPEDVYVASRQAFVEMALAGITAVGEFHYLHHQVDGTPYDDPHELAHRVIAAAHDVGIRICLLRVGYARAGFNVVENPRQRRFIEPNVDVFLKRADELRAKYREARTVSVALAPHSVRAVPRTWLDRLRGLTEPIHMHVAEQPAELRVCRAEHDRTPVALLDECGLLSERFTAVHAVHLEPPDIDALGRTRAGICACPSTERNLGDGIVPADRLLAAGARVCFGSDSQATIDLLEDARELESHLRLIRGRRAVLDPGGGDPDGLGRRLFEMASREGARSLQLPTGELKSGAPADYFAVDLSHPSLVGAAKETLLASVVFGLAPAAIDEVVVDGKVIVQGGRHALAERSGRDFAALSRRIFS